MKMKNMIPNLKKMSNLHKFDALNLKIVMPILVTTVHLAKNAPLFLPTIP